MIKHITTLLRRIKYYLSAQKQDEINAIETNKHKLLRRIKYYFSEQKQKQGKIDKLFKSKKVY